MVEYLNLIEGYSDRYIVKTIDGKTSTCKSYSDYCRDIRVSAGKLEALLGNVEGKHIGILTCGSYEYLVLLAAIIFSRAVAVPISIRETAFNIERAIKKAALEKINVSVETRPISFFFQGHGVEKELRDFDDSEGDKEALIVFTSGTTSLAKGVVLTVRSLFSIQRNFLPEEFRGGACENPGFTAYIHLPFYHIGGIMPWISWSELGGTLCLSKDCRNMKSDIEANIIDTAVVTPAVLKMWAKCLRMGKKERLGGVKYVYVAGAAADTDIVRLFFDNGIDIIQIYGMTESGGDITVNPDMYGHSDSVGKAVAGVSLCIIDGEICVSSVANMKCYYKDPEETKEVLKDGVLHTGDLGYIDDEGYVYITGRKKNLIILSGGENISPEELENELYGDQRIKECRVYEKDDRIAADVYAPEATYDEIKKYIADLNARLPVYKRIYKLSLLDTSLEKNAMDKIKR